MIRFAFLLFLTLLVYPAYSESNQAEKPDESSAPLSLDELLTRVEQGRVFDAHVNRERLTRFKADKEQQQQRLTNLLNDKKIAESKSDQLEADFQKNDEVIAGLENTLDERLGSIKELFGVLQLVSSDAHAQLTHSISHIQFPDRANYLLDFSNKMGQTKKLPEIIEIEKLWFELQREMHASSQVIEINSDVVNAQGVEEQKAITRVGLFNLVADGKYLQFIPETGRVLEYSRQPNARYLAGALDIAQKPVENPVLFSIDPTRGQLLAMLVNEPTLTERIKQGGVIGYVILTIGALALVIATSRIITLLIVQRKIENQIRLPEKLGDNPLARILQVFKKNQDVSLETLELKLGEAVLAELPAINKNLSLLKIFAAIAPLMGLLGTVTGMIITFQAITLFGAGDPKLMANGISQALVTTVLGLTVAIPTLLLHNFVQSRAKTISDILEKESVAIIAQYAENLNEAKHDSTCR